MNDNPMMPCDHVIAKLWEYLDGSLDDLRSEQIRQHLDMCARCFPEYDFRRAYLALMRRCSTQEVAPELRRRIFEMVLAEDGKAKLVTTAATPSLLQRALSTLRRAWGRR